MTRWRTCEVKTGPDAWTRKDMSLVKKGDLFRLFESNGEPVKDEKGNVNFYAIKDAVPIEPEGNYSVEVKK